MSKSIFIALASKINLLEKDMECLSHSVENFISMPKQYRDAWTFNAAVGKGIQSAYSGMEDVMKVIAKDIDQYVPSGDQSHQDLLDQMHTETGDRPAILDDHMYELMCGLKSFRHFVMHRYGAELRTNGVLENLRRLKQAHPLFVKTLMGLEEKMTGEASLIKPAQVKFKGSNIMDVLSQSDDDIAR